MYIANASMLVNIKKCPQMPSQSMYFSKIFQEWHTPDPYHWQAMHADCALRNN